MALEHTDQSASRLKISTLKHRVDSAGFTIIEVLIVLAIAALILLIVFLAVPALQRNSRNTSRARDAADVLASINEYVADNSSLPSTCSGSNAIQWGPTATTQTTTNVSYYNKACVVASPANGDTYLVTVPTNPVSALNGNTVDYLEVVEYDQCSTTTNGAAMAGAARQFAVLYEIENGPGTFGSKCLAS